MFIQVKNISTVRSNKAQQGSKAPDGSGSYRSDRGSIIGGMMIMMMIVGDDGGRWR